MPGALLAAVALFCAGTMGFAIQRGATCTVAAVGEIVERGTAYRLLALAEAALWVACGLLISREAGLLPALPTGVALSPWTIAGGVLLGLGAWLNRACVFGAIARLGSGDWAYAATPAGFFAGAVTAPLLFGEIMPRSIAGPAAITVLSGWIGWLIAPFAVWRLAGMMARPDRHIWHPHEATVVIGLTFVVLLLVAGPWAYTDVLISAAKAMFGMVAFPLMLFLALLVGAWLGGWTAGLLRHQPLSAVGLARSFAGGMLMGWGSLLIPGGNDGLILTGMPLLQPHAWVGIGSMCAAIAVALLIERRVARA